MKRLLCLLLLVILLDKVFCQAKPAKVIEQDTLSNNSVFFEFGGNSLYFGSVNYERILFHKNFFYLAGRIGIGFGYMPGTIMLSSPIIVSGIFHIYKRLYGEIGIGTTLIDYGQQKSGSIYLEHGYRCGRNTVEKQSRILI